MTRALLSSALLFAACSHTGSSSSDMAFNFGDGLGVAPTFDLSGAPADLAGGGSLPISVGPIPLASGQELTVCSRFILPITGGIDVVKLEATLAPGSHHLILWKSMETTEMRDLYPCEPLDLSTGDIPIYIAQTLTNNTLPLPTGVSYHLEPGQMVRLEAHYINATPNPLDGMGSVSLTIGPTGTYQPADIMFCGSISDLTKNLGGKGVPPGQTTLAPRYFKPSPGIKVFGLTTHEHQRGTLMTVDKSTSTAPGLNLTMGTPYSNPPFQIYGDQSLVTFGPNEGFRWQCSYQNDDPTTYYFGQSAVKNEMCFFWAYYYPSVGHFVSIECQE